MHRFHRLTKSWFEKLVTGSYPIDNKASVLPKLSLLPTDKEALRKLEEELRVNEPHTKVLL